VKADLSDPARRGDVAAQNLLGGVELEIEQKPKNARRWFEMSAASGDAVGQRSLGHLYASGLGVKADEARAVGLFRAAAASGDPFAQYSLAMANERAEGAYCTFGETLELLESAAGGGVVEAAAKLGDLLAGVDRDAEAFDWYVRAATAGHVGAMNAAACWSRDGTAGEPDLVQAVRWFLAMLNQGNGDGVHEAIELARAMTPEEIRMAAVLAGRPGDGEAIVATRTS
jgi:TPR repeat protein